MDALTKWTEKRLDGNYTRMLWAIFKKSWREHLTKQQLYGHLPLITKIIKVRHASHCWTSKDELIKDVLLWTPSHRRAKAGRPARIYIQQLCADTGCNPEDLLEAMDEKGSGISMQIAWRDNIYIYIYMCYILTFDPTKNSIPRWCTGRKWHILVAVRRGNRVGGNWLMKWDELKNSHGTLIDWHIETELPVNWMTVISAWWQSNMRFQRSSGQSSGGRTII